MIRHRTTALAAVFALACSIALTPAARAADDQGWSTLKGQIVWAGGDVPERKPLAVAGQNAAQCLANGPILSEDWVINPKNKGVRWVILWLAREPKDNTPLPIHPDLKEIKKKEVVMDQPTCAFIPHALAMREGQDLVVKNSAGFPHNVNWSGNPLRNPGGNVLIPAGSSHTITGLKADKLPLMVTCNIHPWMRGRVAVVEHPYFAVTDENGNFEIPKAPAGEYRLKIYHDANGWLGGAQGRDGQKITIKSGGVTDLGKIEFKPNK